jgi:hypothetical protein
MDKIDMKFLLKQLVRLLVGTISLTSKGYTISVSFDRLHRALRELAETNSKDDKENVSRSLPDIVRLSLLQNPTLLIPCVE